MATKYTINNALAYIAITGSKRFLHTRTLIALELDWVRFQCEDLSQPMYSLSEEAMDRAKKSRLWKAHCHLLGEGFVLDGRRHKPGHIPYRYKDDAERWAFTGSHGRAYITPEGKRYGSELAATYCNG